MITTVYHNERKHRDRQMQGFYSFLLGEGVKGGGRALQLKPPSSYIHCTVYHKG